MNPKARAVRITLALVRANDAGQLANGINERSICLATGKSLSPRSSLRLALPIYTKLRRFEDEGFSSVIAFTVAADVAVYSNMRVKNRRRRWVARPVSR